MESTVMIEVKVKDFRRPESYELFRGVDHEEVVERLVKSKEHANKFIADQAKRLRQNSKQIDTLQDLLAETMAQMITDKLKPQ
jgi:uncharacterized protein YeeX (DUF496 family)